MSRTALDIIREINSKVEENRPPFEVMVRDVQMMNLKIRSLIGDISHVKKVDAAIIESLWRLCMADEIISNNIDDLDEDQQEALITYALSVETTLSEKIRHSFELQPQTQKRAVLKLEIFKESLALPVVN